MEISTKPLADALGQLATHMGLVNSTLGKADENLAFAFATAVFGCENRMQCGALEGAVMAFVGTLQPTGRPMHRLVHVSC